MGSKTKKQQGPGKGKPDLLKSKFHGSVHGDMSVKSPAAHGQMDPLGTIQCSQQQLPYQGHKNFKLHSAGTKSAQGPGPGHPGGLVNEDKKVSV